jgi:NADH pyrophosphatase NudC (nudix superfamily)
MEDNHQCSSMTLAEAWIEKNDQAWLLNINKTATEQDLEENHYLEEVGQVIYQVAVNVNFCPYCGSKLDGSDDNCIPSFELHDFSRGS